MKRLCMSAGALLLAVQATVALGQAPAVPESISTPDKVETQLGTLEFKDGVASDRAGFFSTFLRDVFYDAANARTHKVTPEILAWSVDMAMEAGLLPTLACVESRSGESRGSGT